MFDNINTASGLAGLAILALAYVVRGVAGFGSGLVAMPLLALMFPLQSVVPLIVLLDYLGSASHGLANRKAIRWREIVPLIPFSLAGMAVALLTLARADADGLRHALGAFIIGYAIYALLGHSPTHGATRAWGILAGFMGGLVGTLFGIGGPFYVMYFKARQLGKEAFRATLAAVFLIDGAGRLLGYFGSGLFTPPFLYILALAIPVMAAALYLGGRIHANLSPLAFQRGISVLLIGSGAALLAK
jgi:uncharacterized membrane protein YfcA